MTTATKTKRTVKQIQASVYEMMGISENPQACNIVYNRTKNGDMRLKKTWLAIEWLAKKGVLSTHSITYLCDIKKAIAAMENDLINNSVNNILPFARK